MAEAERPTTRDGLSTTALRLTDHNFQLTAWERRQISPLPTAITYYDM